MCFDIFLGFILLCISDRFIVQFSPSRSIQHGEERLKRKNFFSFVTWNHAYYFIDFRSICGGMAIKLTRPKTMFYLWWNYYYICIYYPPVYQKLADVIYWKDIK